MKKAVVYARVSTEEQAKNGLSIETQLKTIRKYAEENEIEIIGSPFVDEGKSGSTINGRQQLLSMLSFCMDKKSDVDIVLVYEKDRLNRNSEDHHKIRGTLKRRNISIVSVTQPFIDDSIEGQLMDSVLAAVSELMPKIAGRKTSGVLEQKALVGWWPGGVPPQGYRNTDNQYPTSSLDRRIVVPDEKYSPLIISAFEKYATGNFTEAEIAAFLNEEGLPPKYGKRIHASLVGKMLRNPFYIGKFTWNKKEYEGKHSPLISEELFTEVQKVIDQHNNFATRKRRHTMLLRGYIFDRKNGVQIWGEVREKRGKEYRYYFSKTIGKGSYVNAEELESQVQQLMYKIEISEEYRNQILELAKKMLRESRENRNKEELKLEHEIRSYRNAINEAEDDRYIRHTITSEKLTEITTRYNVLIKKAQQKLGGLEVDHEERMAVLEKVLRLAEDIGESYRKAEPVEKKEYLALFFKKLWVEDGKLVDYELNGDLKELVEAGSVRVATTGLPR